MGDTAVCEMHSKVGVPSVFPWAVKSARLWQSLDGDRPSRRKALYFLSLVAGIITGTIAIVLLLSAPEPPEYIMLAPHQNATVPRLPILRELGQDTRWDTYLQRVYGQPLGVSAFPIDLNRFEWFYDDAPFEMHVDPMVLSPSTVVPRAPPGLVQNASLNPS